ncbi:hypothetical protein BG005_009480 [Podila minutissima]|nr:hypothetical protein BG005_009480 [Podila minutissima]
MRLPTLPSLAVLAVALLQTTSAQAISTPDKAPTGYSNADYLSTSNILLISRGETYISKATSIHLERFVSLNLAKDWPVSAPLWKWNPLSPRSRKDPDAGPIGLDKDYTKVYFFGRETHQVFNLNSNTYEPALNYKATPFHPQKYSGHRPSLGTYLWIERGRPGH